MPGEELGLDEHFYIKQDNGEFHGAILYSWEHDKMEVQCYWKITLWIQWFKKMVEEKRAYIRRNKPGHHFGYAK